MPDDDAVGYADAAQTYWDRGWRGVLPLNRGTKWPPPKTFTGYDGVDPSYADVLQWSELYPSGNLCLRLPDGVIGIDVDAYGAKTGAAAFAEAVNRWGPLPEGPQSTSRYDDPVSGLRLYRVPPGTLLETVIVFPELSVGDIEVIQPHHRYVVCWPSIHPEDRPYQWRDSTGEPLAVPAVDELPELPQTWLDGLKLTPRSLDFVGQGYDTRLALTAGSPSPVVSARLQMAIKELNLGGMSRHDTCLRHVMAILRHGAEGQSGVEEALSILREVFVAVVTLDGSRTREIAVVEFNRMVTNNNVARELSQPGILDWFKQVMESSGRSELNTSDDPPAENDPDAQSANVNRAESVGAVTLLGDALPGPDQPSSGGELEALEQDFWTARPQHQLIFDAALSRMASPWAVLASCVARALALVPPSITLPPIIGGRGSLNWFAAIVGKSGSGKGAAAAVARQLVVANREQFQVLAIGSGEGMIECYRRAPAKKGEVPEPVESVMFELPEIDTLGAMTGRSGQTTMSVLRQGFSGEALGFSYRGRQSEGVAEHTYRMTLAASVQPSRAGALLEDAGGGTPQRFMWFPGADKRIDVNGPAWPRDLTDIPLRLNENFPSNFILGSFLGDISIPDEVRIEIASAHAARARGESDALDGHTLFCREKLAFALAYIDGRAEMTLEDWRLSGIATTVSEWTRNRAVEAYQLAKEDEFRDRGQLKGVESAAAELGKSQETTSRITRLVELTLRKIEQSMPDGISNSDLVRRTTARDRGLLGGALDWLKGQGRIMQVEGTTVWVTL